jgi:hypothetical protein
MEKKIIYQVKYIGEIGKEYEIKQYETYDKYYPKCFGEFYSLKEAEKHLAKCYEANILSYQYRLDKLIKN